MNKFLFLVCLFLFACLLLPSMLACQTSDDVYAEVTASATTSPSPAADIAFAEHNRMAINQLYAYVAERLSYPTEMEGLALEGMVTVTFSVAHDGAIRHVRVSDSELPKPFGDALCALIKAKRKIRFTGPTFQGATRFNLPVKFSL